MKTLLFSLLLSSSVLASPASVALDRAPLERCVSDGAWTERSARVTVVLHAGGGWSVLLDEHELVPQLVRPLRECLYRAVRDALDEATPVTKTASFTRVLTGPRAPLDRLPELRARFEAVAPAIADCVLGALPPEKVHRQIPLRLTLTKTGAALIQSPGSDGGVEGMAATVCTERHLGAFAPGSASCEVTLAVDGVGRLVQPDGRVGSTCGHGGPADFEWLLQIVECRPGLRCCNASGARTDPRCMQLPPGGDCPLLP